MDVKYCQKCAGKLRLGGDHRGGWVGVDLCLCGLSASEVARLKSWDNARLKAMLVESARQHRRLIARILLIFLGIVALGVFLGTMPFWIGR